VIPIAGKDLKELIAMGFRAIVEKKCEESVFKDNS
jgi:hypothetical protein